jgi:hypothetical protein
MCLWQCCLSAISQTVTCSSRLSHRWSSEDAANEHTLLGPDNCVHFVAAMLSCTLTGADLVSWQSSMCAGACGEDPRDTEPNLVRWSCVACSTRSLQWCFLCIVAKEPSASSLTCCAAAGESCAINSQYEPIKLPHARKP